MAYDLISALPLSKIVDFKRQYIMCAIGHVCSTDDWRVKMQFFVLVQKIENDSWTEFFPQSAVFGAAPKCNICGAYEGQRRWAPPYRADLQTWGNRFGDVAFGGVDILVSEAFQDAYRAAKLVGLRSFENVEIVHYSGRKRIFAMPPRYLKIDIPLGSTAIDELASGVEWDGIACKRCLLGIKLKRRRNITINEKTWSGDDVFFARGVPGQIVVSLNFKKMCESFCLSNAFFVPAENRR